MYLYLLIMQSNKYLKYDHICQFIQIWVVCSHNPMTARSQPHLDCSIKITQSRFLARYFHLKYDHICQFIQIWVVCSHNLMTACSQPHLDCSIKITRSRFLARYFQFERVKVFLLNVHMWLTMCCHIAHNPNLGIFHFMFVVWVATCGNRF